ncbi:unnamed protein product [Owenia fusiformis]|uniref:Methyltransferase domain-containing protein n=1 Tax=Owenia fusiformis TaxID=6347 RepID=A0A8S4N9I9_OWEFU|nr:unnamed protein product [Owenia fusiformis]
MSENNALINSVIKVIQSTGDRERKENQVSNSIGILLNDSDAKVTSNDAQRIYTAWANTYDKDHDDNVYIYKTPLRAARHFAELFPEVERPRVKVLDIAAGTGTVGQELHKQGFRDIDAVDANQAMLDVAKSKNVYNRLICDFLGPNALDIKDYTYDGAVATACFYKSHVTEDCFPELIRIIKPGGLLLMQIRGDALKEMVGFTEAMKRLENDQKWTLVKEEYFPNWYSDKAINGFRVVYRIS